MGDELDYGVYAPVIATQTFPSIELRRYRMKPGRRDDLIAIFEATFIESQEACGMSPLGHFRDLDDEDAFVWLRGFPSYEARAAALHAFYVDSQAWRENRDAANDTMIDSDDVLLLRPARAQSGFDLRNAVRPALDARDTPVRYALISTVLLEKPPSDATIAAFESAVSEARYFVSDHRPNEFSRLPVREGENAFVSCLLVPTLDDAEHFQKIVDTRFIPSAVEGVLSVEHFRLQPARRSLLR